MTHLRVELCVPSQRGIAIARSRRSGQTGQSGRRRRGFVRSVVGADAQVAQKNLRALAKVSVDHRARLEVPHVHAAAAWRCALRSLISCFVIRTLAVHIVAATASILNLVIRGIPIITIITAITITIIITIIIAVS